MTQQVWNSIFQRCEVLAGKLCFCKAAMHLESTHCCYDNNCIRLESCHPALDIKELLRSEVCTEACLCHCVVTLLEGKASCHDRIAPVCNIGKGTSVYESRCSFQRLYKVRL